MMIFSPLIHLHEKWNCYKIFGRIKLLPEETGGKGKDSRGWIWVSSDRA